MEDMTNRNLILQCEHGLRLRVAASLAEVARDHRSTSVQEILEHGAGI